MEGSYKATLPQSGFVQQGNQTENLQLAVFRSSNIIANYNFPLIAALYLQMEFSVKLIFSLLSILILQGCQTTEVAKIAKFDSIINETNKAKLEVSADLIGLFLYGKVTRLEIFNGCYDKDYDTENVIGHVISEHKNNTSNHLSIPVGDKLYFQFGTTEPNWNCHTHFSFTPLQDEDYKVHYEMVFAGCEVTITNNGSKLPGVEFYSAEPGYSKKWRKCTK